MDKFIKKIILKVIRVYQKTLSPDHGLLSGRYPYGYCRFHPSCSEYSYQAIEKNGIWKGGWQSLKRIGRCNPFNEGGEDPVR